MSLNIESTPSLNSVSSTKRSFKPGYGYGAFKGIRRYMDTRPGRGMSIDGIADPCAYNAIDEFKRDESLGLNLPLFERVDRVKFEHG